MIELVIHQRRRDLGGFEVGRVLPYAKRRMVGPFVFFDHMGPMDMPPGVPRSVDVRPHPHIGLSTVTYLFSGEIMHRDSVGSEQAIRPGEVNWMTAGRGITHSERFERARREGDHLHAIVRCPKSMRQPSPPSRTMRATTFRSGRTATPAAGRSPAMPSACTRVCPPIHRCSTPISRWLQARRPLCPTSTASARSMSPSARSMWRASVTRLARCWSWRPAPCWFHRARVASRWASVSSTGTRLLLAGADRAGEGRLEGRPDEAPRSRQ